MLLTCPLFGLTPSLSAWTYLMEVPYYCVPSCDASATPSSFLDRPMTAQAESDPTQLVAQASAGDDATTNDGAEVSADEDASPGYFVSFAWHPRDDRAIVGVTQAGRLSEVEVPERIAPSWSALHHITWAHGRKLQIHGEKSQLFSAVEDVSGWYRLLRK